MFKIQILTEEFSHIQSKIISALIDKGRGTKIKSVELDKAQEVLAGYMKLLFVKRSLLE